MNEDMKETVADRNYWNSFIKNDNYVLSGWTYRQGATYLHKNGRVSVRIESQTLELLGIIEED